MTLSRLRTKPTWPGSLTPWTSGHSWILRENAVAGTENRCDLALTFLHPAIVYLDEPTIGLDVLARERIRTSSRARRSAA